MIRPQHNYTSLEEFRTFLETSLNYLEKANGSDLGDFTVAGKSRNAGYNNYTVYWQWYKELGYGNLQTQPYCAGAVSTMMVSAFGLSKTKKLLCGDLYVYCPDGYNKFKNQGRIYSTPKKFDIVFFWSSSLNRWGHTGIVIDVDSNGKGYTTWEANTSSGNDVVVRNGGATTRKHYNLNSSTKVAFGRPDYEGNGISLIKPTNELTMYNISTSSTMLTCTVDTNLNVRNYPVTGNIVNSIYHGEKVTATKKTFVNGDPWLWIPEKDGWVSGKYFTGWLCEKTANNRWWFVLDGYSWYSNKEVNILGSTYYFDDTGYMFEGTITKKTDSNGALQIVDMNPY